VPWDWFHGGGPKLAMAFATALVLPNKEVQKISHFVIIRQRQENRLGWFGPEMIMFQIKLSFPSALLRHPLLPNASSPLRRASQSYLMNTQDLDQ
jgi:hypothetical protein